MRVNNGKLYWQDKSKINKIYPYLTHDVKTDILVIGGGISGALTTYFLAKEGANVAVLEKKALAQNLWDFKIAVVIHCVSQPLL